MKMNADQQTESAPDHNRYWLDEKRQPQCADCNPSPKGVAVIEVSSTLDDEQYLQEERKGIQSE